MPRVGRFIRGTGIAVIAGLVLSACSNAMFDQTAATKILQSVDVNLDSNGAITDVAGQAVYLDEISGESDSSEDSFVVEEVVDDLPIRVSTRYETQDDSGTNLEDLAGHTGRVNIEVTVENLTLDSTELTYDVAGESRQTPALVGTPLSIAGSAELDGTRASDVVLDSESDATTNGVVSQTSDGDAVVQWGTVLAPPQSEATTTFQLVADVEEFSTPEIDIAVQAGFHTDMSFEGMLTAAFDTSFNSEYGMQQKAIELVADVNDVLTRAGTTITEIRNTLDHTTDTLGVDAAAQLRQNSDDMVTEMDRVGEQLTALEAQVDSSMTGAETAMNSQLSQIVASMNSMMGNTDATAPQLMQGQGCAASVQDAEASGSLYSSFLVLGAQLDGYAQANAECRDEIVADIEQTLGPEIPDAETCDTSNGGDTSITCALFEAQNSVLTSLDDLVQEGDRIVRELETESIDYALRLNMEIGNKLETIGTRFDGIYEGLDKILDSDDESAQGAADEDGETPQTSQAHGFQGLTHEGSEGDANGSSDNEDPEERDPNENDETEAPVVTWNDLTEAISEARGGLDELQEIVTSHRDGALDDLEDHVETVRGDQERLSVEAEDLSTRHHELAERICSIELPSEEGPDNDNETALDERDQLSVQLVGTDCNDAKPTDPEYLEGSSLDARVNNLVDGPLEGLDTLIEDQQAHWDNALSQLDANNAESAVGALRATLTQLEEQIAEVREQTEEDTAQQIADLEERIDKIKDKAKSKVQRIKDRTQERIDKIKKGARGKISQIKEQAKKEIESVEADAEAEAQRIEDIVTDLQDDKDNIVALAKKDQQKLKNELETLQDELKHDLPEEIRTAFEEVTAETRDNLPQDIDEQVRIVTERIHGARDSVIASYNSTIAGLSTTSDAVINDTADQIDGQKATLEEQQDATASALSESTSAVIEAIHQSTASSTRDLEGASAQLGASLNNVILDLGDPDIQGSGILGSMSASSAMSDTADYQLALASQRAAGYANVRSEDIAKIMLRQAQFSASLEAATSLPAFHLEVPSGARSQTIYAFHIGGDNS